MATLDVHNTASLGRPGSRAHHSIAQRFEWLGGRDVHIVGGMNLALTSRLTLEIHSAASGFRLRISTSAKVCCVDRRLAFNVRMLRVVSEFVDWNSVQKHACRAIADSRSWWKYVGSRVGLSAGKACRNPHAAQSRSGTHRGNTLDRERAYWPDRRAESRMLHNRERALNVEVLWVASGFISRKGTLKHACCAITGLRSPWKRPGSRAGRSAGRAPRYTHAAQSRIHALRRSTHCGTSRFIGRTCTPQRACGTIAGSRSPLKYTGLRVSATAVIPARSGITDHPRGHPHR